MSVNPKFLESLVKQSIIFALRKTGRSIFDLSQQTDLCFVPVQSGFLRQSGSITDIPTGVRIQYTAPYAAKVEAGSPGVPIVGDQILRIRSHTRKGYTRKDGVYVGPAEVKAHIKKYINARIVMFRPKYSKFEYGQPIFRVIKADKARKGQWFLRRALLQKIHDFPADLEFYLKKLERLNGNL